MPLKYADGPHGVIKDDDESFDVLASSKQKARCAGLRRDFELIAPHETAELPTCHGLRYLYNSSFCVALSSHTSHAELHQMGSFRCGCRRDRGGAPGGLICGRSHLEITLGQAKLSQIYISIFPFFYVYSRCQKTFCAIQQEYSYVSR